MSVQALAWVFDCSESRVADRLVLLAIANHCDRYGTDAWPKQSTLAAEARVSTREVVRAVQALVELGELTVEKGVGELGRNRYSLPKMLSAQSDKLSLDEKRLSDNGDIPQVTICHLKGDNGGSAIRKNRPTSINQPSLLPSPPSSEEPAKKSKTDPRYKLFIEVLSVGYKQRKWEFTFTAKDGKALKQLLKEHPTWTLDKFKKCLKNYFASEKVIPGDLPYRYLVRLPRYHAGPLTEFGKLANTALQFSEDNTHYV